MNPEQHSTPSPQESSQYLQPQSTPELPAPPSEPFDPDQEPGGNALSRETAATALVDMALATSLDTTQSAGLTTDASIRPKLQPALAAAAKAKGYTITFTDTGFTLHAGADNTGDKRT